MPNRLAKETSPYLLQHAENPVDWYPWGEEALAESKKRGCPIFLSIGYSACHWCHVMEHESFEDEEIAAYLNEHFVCVKVDREERPDLDQIYMAAVQLMTGRGGWPMSVFLTPDLKPFFGGTYWPRDARHGMPGFGQVLQAVNDAWTNRREQALEQSKMLTDRIEHVVAAAGTTAGGADSSTLVAAATQLERQFDFNHGGFGGAPKFPQPMSLHVLLRTWLRTGREGLLDLVKLNLDKMACGGIYDQLGGGFARYSVDDRWLVPHFEKMLYDNAQLVTIYIDTYKATGEPRFASVARETLDYILRDMTDEAGGFHSAEDADSEGVEGKFYVWTPDQIAAVLGDELAERFCYVYDVSDAGNFEHGQSILNLPKSWEAISKLKGWDAETVQAEMAEARQQLLTERSKRIRPGKDDKVLVSWNGLMIDAMARAGAALHEPRYTGAAVRAAEFILREMRDANGRLLHSWRGGQARFQAYLDDYACLANGLLSLYEATGDEHWIEAATSLADEMLARFAGHESGRLYYTADDHEQLITRAADLFDSATPSGNGMAATALSRLGHLLNHEAYTTAARRIVNSARQTMEESPLGVGQALIALDMLVGPFAELVVVGGSAEQHVHAVAHLHDQYLPNGVIVSRTRDQQTLAEALNPLFEGRPSTDEVTLYRCVGTTCDEPLRGIEAIRATSAD